LSRGPIHAVMHGCSWVAGTSPAMTMINKPKQIA
jgi:hypothetical protein